VRLAIAGGGTGGHLFPGLAIADLARQRGTFEQIVFFGAERGIEARLVPARGYELVAQRLEGMRGRNLGSAIRALRLLGAAVVQSRRELRRRNVDVVLGLGGYASAAAVIAARLVGVPVVLMEQNREPGLSNRALSRLATAVCTSFEDTDRWLPTGRARLTGSPVRVELESLDEARTRDMLLIFGGSGGARSMNRAVVAALIALARERSLPPILHQTGEATLDEVRTAYRDAGLEVDVRPFIDDMASAYARTRLAICRAGATTIAELEATSTPAILIPFPFAAGDHQTANARALVDAGAARLIRDDADTATSLAKTVTELLNCPKTLDSMTLAAARLRRPGAAEKVLCVIEQAAKGTVSRTNER
jgi:UDP-N-acetylglucosamine--N-acetylmuramyl-(pentapeptide) pyrophosphoryl-undecaprenol N-acetylglucosamine transferase